MKLDVKNLVKAPFGQNESFNVELESVEIDENILAERTKGNLSLTHLEDEILAVFDGSIKLKLICDRCLDDFISEKKIKFSQEYLIGRKADGEEKLAVGKDFKIDIIEPLRQEIIAGLSIKKLCRKDCRGLCAHCGVNLNIEKCKCKKKKV